MSENIWQYDFVIQVKDYIKAGYTEKEFYTIDGVAMEFYIDGKDVMIYRWYSSFARIPIRDFFE